MGPAYALTLHCRLSTLQAAALRLCLAAWDFEGAEDHFPWLFNHEDILAQTECDKYKLVNSCSI